MLMLMLMLMLILILILNLMLMLMLNLNLMLMLILGLKSSFTLLAGLPDTPEAHRTLVENQSSTVCDVRLPVSAGHYWAVPLWNELCGVSC